jgi:hypothetical protein
VTTEKPDPADEIHQRTLDRARAIVAAFIDAAHPLRLDAQQQAPLTMWLGVAFHAAGDGLHEEADATVERRKKGWQGLSKEYRTVAARLVGIGQDLAELAKEPLDDWPLPGDPDPNAEHDHAHDAQVTADAAAGTVRKNGTGEIVTPAEPELTVNMISAYREVSAEEAEMINNPPAWLVTAGELMDDAAKRMETQLFADRPVEPGGMTAKIHNPFLAPVEGSAETEAYLAGETDVVPDLGDPGLASADFTVTFPADNEIKEVIQGMVDMGPLEVGDPLPPAQQFAHEPFPGAAQHRRTYLDLLRPFDPASAPDHWSFSQLEGSEDCGVQHRLGRLEHVPQQPQWANIGGTTFHNVSEAFDRGAWLAGGADLLAEPVADLVRQRWESAFQAEIARVAEATGIEMGDEGQHYRASNKGLENYTWWLIEGPLMLGRYITMRRKLDKAQRDAGAPIMPLMLGTPSTPDVPVIEYAYRRPLATPLGMLSIEGVIDRAYRLADGSIMIIDLKSGRGQPKQAQLGEYAWALVHLLGSTPTIRARFYDARKDIFSDAIEPLTAHPHEEFVLRYGLAEAKRRTGLYQPRRSPFCNGCSVKHACPVGDV